MDIAATFQQGLALHRAGHTVEARKVYSDILAFSPNDFNALYALALVDTDLGEYEQARRQIERVLEIDSTVAPVHYNHGNILNALKHYDAAIASFDRAIAIHADYATAYLGRGRAFEGLNRHSEALADFDRAIAINANLAEAYDGRGKVLGSRSQLEQALVAFERAIALKPDFADAHSNRAITLAALKRHDEAIQGFDRAIAINPKYVAAYLDRGRAFGELGRLSEAASDFDTVISLNPNHAEAHNDRGKTFGSEGFLEQAIIHFDRAIVLKSDFAEAYANRARALVALSRDGEALESFAHALALKPSDADVHKGYANALNRCARPEDALASFDRALVLDPNCVASHNGRGTVLEVLGRHQDAVASFQRVIELDSSSVEAYVNCAAAFLNTARYDDALRYAEQAIALNPTFGPGHLQRGVALDRLGRLEEALEAYGRAIECDPEIELIAGRRFYCLMQICRWDGIDAEAALLLNQVDTGHLATAPFYILMAPSSPMQQRQVAELYSRQKYGIGDYPLLPRRQKGGKIRIGYFSADFHIHAVTHLAAGLFEAHDRSDFEIIGFTFSGVAPDGMTRRLEAAFDQFIDVTAKTDREIADLARSMNIDIAVDLTGHTFGGRPGIFAHRVAPIQVNYLGYPGTLGLDAMDYLIADPLMVPPEHQKYYCEKIAYLPSYQVNDWRRAIPTRRISREDLGLPKDGFVFCAFNSAYKITPAVFDIWMRLLHQVEGSVLWLREGEPAAVHNLRSEAERRGVSATRLVFAKRATMAEHLVRHEAADLFLDSLTYSAHTTASDALWCGLPVLTMLGETFPGRVAASLLTAVGLPHLITHTPDQYEKLALDLATDPHKLAKLKQHLRDNRQTCALFDTARFARNIEAAYRKMWDIYEKTGVPEHFHITDI